jgi:anti-sigma factor RsiW
MGFLAVIATTGLWLARPIWQPPPLDVQSITFHHLHTLNPPANSSLTTNDIGQATQWLQARTGEASSAPPLRIAMAGVGVCDVAGAPAVIWMYRAPEAISVIEVRGRNRLPDWPEVNERFRIGVYGGYNTVLWQSNGRTYAMVSRLPRDRMLSLVEHVP